MLYYPVESSEIRVGERKAVKLFCDMIARNNSNHRGIKLTGMDTGKYH